MSGLFKSTTIKGNRLTDFAQTTATVGVVIPFGYGSFPVDGNIIWAPLPPKETRTVKRQGKGGVKQEGFTYTLSYAVAFCKGQIYGYRWIKRGGKVVYSTEPGVPVDDAAYAAKWAAKVSFFYGSKTQLPDSTIESYEGTGQVSAFRDLSYIVVEDDNVTENGGAIPPYEACPIRGVGPVVTTTLYPVNVIDEILADAVSVTGELRQALFEYLFLEEIDADAASVSGALRSLVIPYSIPVESIDVNAASVSGILKPIVIAYTNWPAEEVNATASSVSGLLDQTVIPYNNWPAEEVNVTAQSISGSLT